VRRSIIVAEWSQDFINRRLADVDQHVGVREPLHCSDLIPLCLRHNSVEWLSAIILLQDLAVRHACHPVIIKLEPRGSPIWFDESEVVSTMKVTGVNEDTVELVFTGLGPVSRHVEEFVKVDFEGEFETIVDLWGVIGTCSSWGKITRTLTMASRCMSYS
jgi:hypothetical protein